MEMDAFITACRRRRIPADRVSSSEFTAVTLPKGMHRVGRRPARHRRLGTMPPRSKLFFRNSGQSVMDFSGIIKMITDE